MDQIPATYNDLKAVITARYNALPRQLKKFGRFALDNSDILALETVTTVAQRADVQPSTIIRFAKAIGYDGFSDLQQICRNRLMEDTSSYRERIKSFRSEGPESAGSRLNEFCEAGMDALDHLRLNTPSDKLEQAVGILKGARDIHLFGQGRSFAVAQYLHYALSRLEIRCFLADGAGGMLKYQLGIAGPSDAVIAISFSPYTPVVNSVVTDLAGQGVQVISITDSPLSPLAEPSAVSFEIAEAQDQTFRTLVAPLCLAQSLVVSLGQAIAEMQPRRPATKDEL
ncbi:MAG: MurR/RpiR family transcriptional regulator [Rhodospirillaceae bacterium]|nr:MurR/RpiR family transcriptional regulator [Rhodospirillaceae bacterium]MBL6931593.1 MurR/RpiR family transcriptional regulator [Rhodospirillales bacterium]